ncbi:carbon-phosphorus lyase complex subunit PhnI [Brevibacterium album]|uniref:carbon-phosphorus lyase complex subunit PhnI n=1 Tax=Brevibacterium album TaxID=417948 RepID=UPI0004101864|nr:carbon-phosphorus lyase complex subunit PhnI [Brevibacterium album]
MGYAGVNKGGTSAILAAEELLRQRRASVPPLDPETVAAAFGEILDQIMGEGALWDPELAARAFVQAGGDTAEAVHLLRAHRSTLPRLAFSVPIDPDSVRLLRRVVSAHRSPDGPQLLGETVDYSPRIMSGPGPGDPLGAAVEQLAGDTAGASTRVHEDRAPQRYTSYLAERDLLAAREDPGDPEPVDLALTPVSLPAERSALLSAMAIAETGALVNQWYRGVCGPDGHTDESVTLGEVRHGEYDVRVVHPLTGRPVVVGAIRASECEAIDHLDQRGQDSSKFEAGYGFALGHNERKAIAMASMDSAVHRARGTALGRELEQTVMHTLDGLAANGFLEHLKLPHYVTFRSQVERAEAARDEAAGAPVPGDEAAEAPRSAAPAPASAPESAPAPVPEGADR